MKVLVISVGGVLSSPVIVLCETLVVLRHNVTVLARNCGKLPSWFLSSNLLDTVDLGIRPSGKARIANDLFIEAKVRRFCKEHARDFDIVWTTSDRAARACGKTLLGIRHVMQLKELAEYTPLFSNRDMPLHASIVPELARRAYRVVVPEYNRAFIQQAWWRLERTPAVLPNKCVPSQDADYFETRNDILNLFTSEKRKILLYQGSFGVDRNFSQVISAMDSIGNDFALYLMGVMDTDWERLEAMRDGRDNVVLVPHVTPPNHLAYTKYGFIGLLLYKPSYGRASPLNALYCAPNKVWEYSKFGLPMIGSNVPGLTSLFSREGLGITCDINNSASFIEAVRKISSDYDSYSCRSREYFQSVDFASIVQGILEGE